MGTSANTKHCTYKQLQECSLPTAYKIMYTVKAMYNLYLLGTTHTTVCWGKEEEKEIA